MSDLPVDQTTPAVLTVGGTYSDTLDSAGDRDWIRIDLGPNEYVEIALEGIGLSDPYLRLYDSGGTLVAQNDDGGPGLNSVLTFGNAIGGTYYIEAGAYADSGAGTYELSATPAPEPSPVDALDSGRKRTDTDSPITVYFVPNGESRDGVTSEGWSDYEIERVEAGLNAISAVTNVTFETSSDPNADFQLVLDEDEFDSPGSLGYFYLPSGNSSSAGVFNASGYGWNTTGGLEQGGLGYATVIHEILHGLGLAHPHDGTVLSGVSTAFGDYGDFDLNQGVFTTMSYNGGNIVGPSARTTYGQEAGPMALDIAALQALYGANTTHAGGNDVYALPDSNIVGTAWHSIWDTGGTDEITYDGSRDVIIDLRPATLQYEEGGGGFLSYASGIAGGYTIAADVVIENARSGDGNDTLTGNDADNILDGGLGSDTLAGGRGEDRLIGGEGDDSLTGGSFSDSLLGGAGNDTIDGGTNYDTVIFTGGDTRVSVNLESGAATIGADTDVIINVEHVFASAFDDTIYGTHLHGNRLEGSAGDDTIYGLNGRDTLLGGDDDDRLLGGSDVDWLLGGDGADFLDGGSGTDFLTGGSGNDNFVFRDISDTGVGRYKRDEIRDFNAAEGDLVNLYLIDADTTMAGNQAFRFVGDAFTGNAGDVILKDYVFSGIDVTIVSMDVDGDAVVDGQVYIVGGAEITDFLL